MPTGPWPPRAGPAAASIRRKGDIKGCSQDADNILRAATTGVMFHRMRTIPAVVLAAAAAAIVLIAVLQGRSDTSRRAQAQLGQISTQVTESTDAPMSVMFGAPAGPVRAEINRVNAQIERTVDSLRADAPVPGLAEVQRALAGSLASEGVMFDLSAQIATAQGRAALAHALTGNDPAFTRLLLEMQRSAVRLEGALKQAQSQYAGQAQSAERQATIGSTAAILLLVLAFGLAHRRSVRARAHAEKLAAENGRMAQASQQEALTDALTGLGNRRALVAALDGALAEIETRPAALALFDLDGFKQYNDTFGHPAGDALLRRLAERVSAVLDHRASAFRMGGDEFCVLARLDGDDALSIARTAAEALSEKGEMFSIGCSFGIALVPSEASSVEEALRIADVRMYEQKAAAKRTTATRQTADALLQVLVERNGSLAEHSEDVARLAAMTARRLGMTEFEVRQVHLAAQLHDVGKSAIPDSILNKPGPLDDDEWKFIERHTVIGERIVRAATSISHAAPIIRSSHERIDGTGYPDRLRAEEIPLGARIIAVCDAFDAMITTRSYRPGLEISQALDELRRCAGSQFDPRVVDEFCRLAEAPVHPAGAVS